MGSDIPGHNDYRSVNTLRAPAHQHPTRSPSSSSSAMIEEHDRPHLHNVIAAPLRQGMSLKRKIKEGLSNRNHPSRSASNERPADAKSSHSVDSQISRSSKESADQMSQESTLASSNAVSARDGLETTEVRDGTSWDRSNAQGIDTEAEVSNASPSRGRSTGPVGHENTLLALKPSPASRISSGLISESQSTPNLVNTASNPTLQRTSAVSTGSPRTLDSGSDTTSFEKKGDRDIRQPSFFSSVMSAAQSAATQITSLTNNAQDGMLQHASPLAPTELHRPRSHTEPAATAEPMENNKAAEPMGNGDLSMTHLGIDEGQGENGNTRKTAQHSAIEQSRSVSRSRERRGSSSVVGKSPDRSQSSSGHRIPLPLIKRGTSSPPTKGSAGLAIASNKRQKEFHSLFKSVPGTDNMIEDYGCALARDILLQGRMFVSEEHICFNSNIFGWVTTLVVAFHEIVSIEKKSTAGIFPNALVISTLHSKHQFSSLIARDSTYELIAKIWKAKCSGVRGNESSMRRSSTEFSSEETGTSDSEDDDESVFEEADGGTEDGSLDSAKIKAAPSKTKSEGGASGPVSDVEASGPKEHGPTECKCLNSGDHLSQILDETINAPLGRVIDIAYGKDKKWQENFLSEGQKCSDVNVTDWKEGNETKQTREFTYVKPLNGPVGPKSTKCSITETIEHQDLESYVTISSSTSTPDVPSGGAFAVKMRTCLMWGENNTTRIIMGCNTEWTGKSWLKGPIEKGVNDGQQTYCNDLIEAIRKEINPSASKKSKKRKQKSTRNGQSQPSANEQGAWYSSLLDMSPSLSHLAPLIIILLLSVFIFRLWRFEKTLTDVLIQRSGNSGWDETWVAEEDGLWDWLDTRVGDPLSNKRPSSSSRRHSNDRELKEAIRTTEQKLDVLKERVDYKA